MSKGQVLIGLVMVLLLLSGCATNAAKPVAVEAFHADESAESAGGQPDVTPVSANPVQAEVAATDTISTEIVDAVTWQLMQGQIQWDAIRQYLPYMSSNNIQRISEQVFPIYEKNKQTPPDISGYLGKGEKAASVQPLTRDQLDGFTLELMNNTGRWELVQPWMPYMSPEGIQAVTALYLSKGQSLPGTEEETGASRQAQASEGPQVKDDFDYEQLKRLDGMTAAQVDALALEYIAKTGQFGHVYNMRPHMTTSGIDAAVNAYPDQGGDIGVVGAMLDGMSRETARKVAQKYEAEKTDSVFDWIFKSWL